MSESTTVVLDIWGGEMHMEHVARYMVALETAHTQILSEVRAGFLVNIRAEAAWGPADGFDDRIETVRARREKRTSRKSTEAAGERYD